MKSKRQIKREQADKHNKEFMAEKERVSKLTPEEYQRELITKSVKAAIKDIKPQLDNLIGK